MLNTIILFVCIKLRIFCVVTKLWFPPNFGRRNWGGPSAGMHIENPNSGKGFNFSSVDLGVGTFLTIVQPGG